MFFHFHSVKIVKCKLWNASNSNCKCSSKISLFCLKINRFINLLGWKNVVSDRNVVHKYAFEFICLCTQNFVFLERFKVVDREISHYWFCTVSWDRFFCLFKSKFSHCGDCFLSRGFGIWTLKLDLFTIYKVYSISIDDSVTWTLNFKVVGNQVNGAAVDERVRGFGWRIAEPAWVATRRVAASSLSDVGGIWLAVTTLTSHLRILLLLRWILTSLRMMRWLLHVAWVAENWLLSLHWIKLLLGAVELILALVILLRATRLVAIWLLVKILVVWLLHLV